MDPYEHENLAQSLKTWAASRELIPPTACQLHASGFAFWLKQTFPDWESEYSGNVWALYLAYEAGAQFVLRGGDTD